ncbi:hypothetical protein OXE08_004534 [Salmonella enterica]|nr:hypothetical protein [Salmonella enterica]
MKFLLGWLIFKLFSGEFAYNSPLEIVGLIVALAVVVFVAVFVWVLVKQWLARPSRKAREQAEINQMFDQMVEDWEKGKR